MNEIKVFENQEFGKVRTLLVNDEPWFVGKDVAEVLGYKKPLNALSTHVDEDDSLKQGLTDSLGRTQETIIINESGLYSLILSSKLPNAKKFKKWVTSEVLPSIRKNGLYATEELLNNPDFLIEALTKLKEERDKNKLLSQQLVDEKDKILKLETKIYEDKEKVDYADAVECNGHSVTVGEFCKVINKNGIKCTQYEFRLFLLNNNYLMKDELTRNIPTQFSINHGWMEAENKCGFNRFGNYYDQTTALITGKGKLYFLKKFKEYINQEGYVKPKRKKAKSTDKKIASDSVIEERLKKDGLSLTHNFVKLEEFYIKYINGEIKLVDVCEHYKQSKFAMMQQFEKLEKYILE